MYRLARLVLLAGMLLAGTTVAQDLLEVPALNTRVTDLANVIDASAEAALETRLAELEQRTGSQAAVLVVESTAPEAIEQYSIRVVDRWQLGRADHDDGVLILLAVRDRAVRIEVGYGLEGALPDALASRIIYNMMTPRFAEANYAAGINAGFDAIEAAIAGEELPAPVAEKNYGSQIGQMFPLLLFVAIAVGGILKSVLGALPGAAATGGIAGLIAWFFVGVLGTAALVAFMVFVFSLLSASGSRSWSAGRGFGGGFGGGFGRGGGGFGGGGGSFGGGGASGRW